METEEAYTIKISGTSVLRIGMSMVFLWFATQQFIAPELWVGFIPQWILNISPVSAVTLVHFNGALELVFGSTLLFGLFTKTSALILSLHMAHITVMVGYDAIGVRDFGLAVATFSVFLTGADFFTVDHHFLFLEKIPDAKSLLTETALQKVNS